MNAEIARRLSTRKKVLSNKKFDEKLVKVVTKNLLVRIEEVSRRGGRSLMWLQQPHFPTESITNEVGKLGFVVTDGPTLSSSNGKYWNTVNIAW